ncbi:hypothetical protein CNR22_11610 [Sphingobacteriaceae bacterium]|nr:hypothetical protein CNR22_11610 [Sphingobacteriaceae bacterium]
MKKFLLPLLVLLANFNYAQHQHLCAKSKQGAMARQGNIQARMSANPSSQLIHETKYDVKFVHLNLNLERINKNISGNVKTVATVTAAALDTFQTILHQNYIVDSIYFNGVSMPNIRQDSMIKVGMPVALLTASSFTSIVYYHGTAPTGGSAIGSGFSSANSWYGGGNRATWSLSESFVAYHWWPCKQMLTDKIDSSWVYVTTDSANKVGSNGVLQNVVSIGNKKRYEWKSRSMIDYYLISVAVSKFKEYNLYAKPQYLANDSILIQNYIDASAWTNNTWINNDKVELNKMPATMNFLCNLYGMYPFYKEKYGHCMVPLGGGMEHNTMTTIGFFDFYIDAHELGHQWWGDNVTCQSWKDIWINEGFASYTEHLVAQYLDPPSFQSNLTTAHNNVMSMSGGSCFFTGADTMNSNIIFDSRLTYDKGGAIIHTLRFITNNDSLWFQTLRGFQNTYKNSTATVIDFKNYYQAQTGIDPTQFFDQWYYGEGYPTFNVKYNYTGTDIIIKSTQSVSAPSSVPLFITPMEYKIGRLGKADTTIKVMHSNATEIYTVSLTGTVTNVSCDPKNWVINKTVGPTRDATLGVTSPVNSVGIKETELFAKLKVGPNPTKGTLLISNEGQVNGTAKVFSVEGKLLAEKSLTTETTFELSSYSSGIYLLKIYDSAKNEKFSQKIIKE